MTAPAPAAPASAARASAARAPAAPGGVGYRQLWAADPEAWRSAGVAWRSAVGLVGRRTDELTSDAAALRQGWVGPAATAADGRLTRVRAELTTVVPALIEVDQVLDGFAVRLGAAKARLDAAVTLADRTGVRVDRHGRVEADPARLAPERAGPAVTGVASALRTALELATAADQEAAGRLAGLAAAARTTWTTPPPPARPALGADPALVSAWWSGLTAAQRRWLVANEPALVGGLDGIPATARDQANRLLLAVRRQELLAERARLCQRVPPSPVELADLLRVNGSLAGLDALTDRLAAPGGPRGYLLSLSTGGEGRAVVALGDPDRADRVLTYVPGMSAGLDDVSGELGRAGRVLARCATLAPGEESAAVLWLDYDAPDFLHEAAGSGRATDAGPALHRFQEGLRATHDGPPARQTVLGHSYGSLVVGATARDHGLAADALVFVGSPGAGVAHAAQLGLPPGQVWASTAPDDVIRAVRSPDHLLRHPLLATSPLGAVAALTAGPRDELWFGHDPTDPGFGGRTFPSGRHGHSGYWDADNPALDGMARVVLGR